MLWAVWVGADVISLNLHPLLLGCLYRKRDPSSKGCLRHLMLKKQNLVETAKLVQSSEVQEDSNWQLLIK